VTGRAEAAKRVTASGRLGQSELLEQLLLVEVLIELDDDAVLAAGPTWNLGHKRKPQLPLDSSALGQA
jgi:hypothetical protein